MLTTNFSGGSKLNGTPGGDRWARVLGGQIGWLWDPFRRVHAGCSETGSTNEFGNAKTHGKHGKKIRPTQNTPRSPQQQTRKNSPPPPKTHHEIHSRPATASNSRRHAMKHVPRVSPYSPDSIDPGFVEIDLVQLSQSVKTTHVTHTHTHTPTDKLNNGTLYAPRYEGAFLPKSKNGLIKNDECHTHIRT